MNRKTVDCKSKLVHLHRPSIPSFVRQNANVQIGYCADRFSQLIVCLTAFKGAKQPICAVRIRQHGALTGFAWFLSSDVQKWAPVNVFTHLSWLRFALVRLNGPSISSISHPSPLLTTSCLVGAPYRWLWPPQVSIMVSKFGLQHLMEKYLKRFLLLFSKTDRIKIPCPC